MVASAVLHRSFDANLPEVVAGQGCWLIDRAGRRYLDASGGAAVSCLGHGHPGVVAAVQAGIEVVAIKRWQVGEHRGAPGGQPEPIAEQPRAQPDGDGEACGAQPVSLPGVGRRLHVDLWLYRPDRLPLLQDRCGG